MAVDSSLEQDVNSRELKLLILNSLQTLFGDMGAAICFDIIKYEPCRAFLRVPAKDYVRLHLALTMITDREDRPCRIVIHKTSHSLASLTFSNDIVDGPENIISSD